VDEKINLLFLYAVFVVLSLTDLFFTSIIVGEDPARELNPLASILLQEGSGYFGLLSVKIQSCIIVGICVWAISKFKPVMAKWVLYFGISVLLFVTAYHLYLFFVICYCDLVESFVALPNK